ncbi:MAG: 50S ribosomal protein L24 [Acidimicrobiia bacterium]|nr:50S ribosomal protein L24 [Acidimicrobiia bacterium]MBV8304749.1 50S ribosomal protein L24 [Acidimicrobiia bacterium]
MAMKIKKGDRVRVLSGKDRGKEGEVMRALPSQGKVIVDGVNRVKKNQRQTRATMQGGIIDKDMPMPVSSVAVVCSTCGATRVGFRFDDQGRKIRVCKKCGSDL